MANTTFSGPLRVGRATGAVDETVGTLLAVRTVALPVTATANTDIQLYMPKCRITSMIVFTDTAYGAATDATLQVGTAQGGAQYAAATSIKSQAKVVLSFAAAAAAFPVNAEGTVLWLRIVQSGAASATGSATLVVEYVPIAA